VNREKLYHCINVFSKDEGLNSVKKGRHRKANRKIALERIHVLFKQAIALFAVEMDLARRYVDLARKIGMRYKVRLPTEYRWMICKHCKDFLFPGKTCRTRIQQRREPHIVVTCHSCGGYNRIPLNKRGSKT
jgi:ribonuclease P protein subunit RPR2